MTTQDVSGEISGICTLLDLGRYQEAAARSQNLLAADPENPNCAALLAQAALGLRNDSLALEAAQRAASLAPQWWRPHHLMSIALSRAGEHERAINAAGEGLRLAPEEYVAHLRLAEALLEDGRPAHARPFVERAVELAPEAVSPHFVAGRLAVAEGRPDVAARAFTHALSIHPNHAPSHNELARLRLGKGRRAAFRAAALADAAGGFATGVRADPRNETIRRNLDISIVGFLGTTAYFVFLADFIGFKVATDTHSSVTKDLPLILLALPLVYATRFMARLQPQLRAFVVDVVLHRRPIRAAMALLVCAVVLIVGEGFAASGTRPVFAGLAFYCALFSRLVLRSHQRSLLGIRSQGWWKRNILRRRRG